MKCLFRENNFFFKYEKIEYIWIFEYASIDFFKSLNFFDFSRVISAEIIKARPLGGRSEPDDFSDSIWALS